MSLILLAGILLRVVFPSRMAVEHFDEGVYASNLWFGPEAGFAYPARHLYAPPLLPGLSEWSQIVLGTNAWGAMFPGILAGCLTILAIWRVVRRWFGLSAGLAAASLSAFSHYHIIYSRTVLTEPVLCLLLVLAVHYLWRFVAEGNFRLALGAGLFTGLAWATKYNGWLPLAIGIAGLSAWAIFPKIKNPNRGRRFGCLLITTAIAGLMFLPVWWGLQDVGGYKAVLENHARYVVGLQGWLASTTRQIGNHQFLDGQLSWCGIFLAVVVSRIGFSLEHTKNDKDSASTSWGIAGTFAVAITLTALAAYLGTSVVLGGLGILWLIIVCPWWSGISQAEDMPKNLAYWFLAAWFVGLLLATPLYTPYPRLSLPWLVSAWWAGAACLGSSRIQALFSGNLSPSLRPLIILGLSGFAGASVFLAIGKRDAEPNSPQSPWLERAELAKTVHTIQRRLHAEFPGDVILYIYAEPAVFYHLRAQGLEAVAPVADLGFAAQPATVPTFLFLGPHAERSEHFQQTWKQSAQHFERVGSYAFFPSELVLLNQNSAKTLKDPKFEREQVLKIYRLKSP